MENINWSKHGTIATWAVGIASIGVMLWLGLRQPASAGQGAQAAGGGPMSPVLFIVIALIYAGGISFSSWLHWKSKMAGIPNLHERLKQIEEQQLADLHESVKRDRRLIEDIKVLIPELQNKTQLLQDWHLAEVDKTKSNFALARQWTDTVNGKVGDLNQKLDVLLDDYRKRQGLSS
jgi:hypothetical protein